MTELPGDAAQGFSVQEALIRILTATAATIPQQPLLASLFHLLPGSESVCLELMQEKLSGKFWEYEDIYILGNEGFLK